MKKLLLILSLAFMVPAFIGCSTPANQRVQTVTSLKIVGLSVDTLMKTAATLYESGQITQSQWDRLAVVHDEQFQPAFNLAVASARSDLSSIASPDILALANQLSTLILSYQQK